MNSSHAKLMEKARSSPLAWDPVSGGRRAWVSFDDDKTYDLGPDNDGTGFELIADRILSGNYYPADAVQFDGDFRTEDRPLEVGDRILQSAPLFPGVKQPSVYSAVQIYVAHRAIGTATIGYVTTKFHHGRGIWSAQLTRIDGRLSLRVSSTTSPNSWLFWIGLPYARFLQLRARRRAVEEFRKILLSRPA